MRRSYCTQTEDMQYHFRKKAFRHPGLEDWAAPEREALADAAARSGDAAFYAAAAELYAQQVAAFGGEAALAVRAPMRCDRICARRLDTIFFDRIRCDRNRCGSIGPHRLRTLRLAAAFPRPR